MSLLGILFLSTALGRKRGEGMGFGCFCCLEEYLFIGLVHYLTTEWWEQCGSDILFSLPDYLNHTGWHVMVLGWYSYFFHEPNAQGQLLALVRREWQSSSRCWHKCGCQWLGWQDGANMKTFRCVLSWAQQVKSNRRAWAQGWLLWWRKGFPLSPPLGTVW